MARIVRKASASPVPAVAARPGAAARGRDGSRSALLAWLACSLLAAPAAFATGYLSVVSSPNGAEVWYTGPEDPDRKYLGDTPLENRELATGRYNLWLILPSHDTLEVPEVHIAEGQLTLVNREIPTHYGYLELATSPDSATLWLDGVKAGTSPFQNNLMLPGKRKVRIDPRPALFRNTALDLSIEKGDTIRMEVLSPYRNKGFLRENLSLTPWRLQIEFGLQQRTSTGLYDSAGKRDKFSNREKRGQTDFPMAARLGLPQGFEAHLLLPFKAYDDKDSFAVFPGNMELGIKYTYRPFNVGADIRYGLGFENGRDALSHDYLALTVLGMASKGDIVADASAGFEFHFTDKNDSEFDPGDQAVVNARVGYLLDPWLPYLGLTGVFRLDSDADGNAVEDGGYLVVPEPGVVLDIDHYLSFQVGIPFTVLGSTSKDAFVETAPGTPKSPTRRTFRSYWGIHGSVAFSLDIL